MAGFACFAVYLLYSERQRILGTARNHVYEVLAHNPKHNIYQEGVAAVPDEDPEWNYQRGSQNLERRDHMVACLLEGMNRYMKRPINYEKVKEVSQDKDENAALFQSI